MNIIKIGAAALNQIPLDWNGNLSRIKAVIKQAYNENVAILLLPELCISGYGCEDAFFSYDVQLKSKESLIEIIRYIKTIDSFGKIVVSVGLPYFYHGAIYNVAALIDRDGVIAFVPKQNLANDGVHYEGRWFKAWVPGKVDKEENIVFGDLLVDFNGVKIGYEICQDAWVSNRPGINHAKRGVDIILNPSASHFAFGKHNLRKQFIKEGSRAFKCAYVYANLLGNESGSSIFEGDTIIAAGNNIVASGKRLSFQDSILTTAIIDLHEIKTTQVMDGSFHSNLEMFGYVNANYNLHTVPLESNASKLKAENWRKEEEFSHAEALALFDYMRKSRSNGYLNSLSGGVDSTVICCLIKFMHDFGIEELGKEKFIEKTGIKFNNKENLMSQLLTCIYQSTENSSQDTFNSAKNVATSIGATFLNWEIDKVIDIYQNMVQSALNINLSWNEHDVALQNIQARVRIPGLWMIANIKNALLICTSNRSETAVGYCTADGDLSGSLAPIAGINKDFLLNWLNWIYNELGEDNIWMNSLENLLFNIKPSAELRPQNMHQEDEKDLMPYNILDFIEKKAIVQKKSPKEVFEYLKIQFNEIDENLLKTYTNKFFKLWSKNQWKRAKSPISFMLDEESLDPKNWCRFPILSGEFEII